MTTRAPFLSQRYGAYYHREVPEPDEELTSVSPGTPCGDYLRRFWHPVIESDALTDLPKSIKVLGEELVAFRDGRGNAGVLELHCSHRGTSLEYGQIESNGIRCCYHGWLFGVDGEILDTPGEPPESTFKERLCHGAYPVIEYKGLVFTYMGPPGLRPPFPMYDIFKDVPGYCLGKPGREHWPCNWLQVKDNCMDPAHTAFLHTIEFGHGFTEAFKEFGQLDFMETPIGMIYMHSRRIGEHVWVRITDYIAPTLHQIGINTEDAKSEHPPGLPWVIFWLVPADDTESFAFTLRFHPGDEPRPARVGFAMDDSRPYQERQKVPGDYEAQTSQRSIAVHGLEHLGDTDRGIIMLRRLLRRNIRAVANGETPVTPPVQGDEFVPTYASNTVVRVAPGDTPEADERILKETARKVAQGMLDGSHPRTNHLR